ncbi:hypothetical protein O1611_g2071 [Lasiodiplodia mahajangana]|uniref:Uncharacterized protein n=1 Tax=Lasiodiplodia mahajangana TaxID=1108764 RepID=A0ACC2JVK4_9PEZI|nr:hypothetical protein O1611_g2071 [Lasiodiplodia mahajangana]
MLRRRGRDRLQADIQAASHETIPHVQKVGKGDVQDEFVFTFSHPQAPHGEIEIRVMPQDIGGYPDDNDFLVYTNDNVSPDIGEILDSAMESTTGLSIEELLRALSDQLCASLEPANEIEGASLEVLEGSNDGDIDVPFDHDDDDYFGLHGASQGAATRMKTLDHILERIRQDFRTVRDAGFRVSKICGVDYISEHSIMTISVKASKLGLSEETHMAWNLESSDYIVLLMMYSGEYTSLEDAMSAPAGQIPLCFKLRKCSKYRPTSSEAIETLAASLPNSDPRQFGLKTLVTEDSREYGGKLSSFGVGDSIDLLLSNGFITMLKLRKMGNFSWDDAKKIYSEAAISAWDNDSINIPTSGPTSVSHSAHITDKNLPPILLNDHLLSKEPSSLPLVAMQFALRYLVKCTDYCMICHEKMAENFDALKPYVCANPLCLFQYMSLGLGPSIDDEIINQQHVVDLLISFCYASLQCSKDQKLRLREFPLGLSIQVPCIRKPVIAYNSHSGQIVMSKNNNTLINPLEIEVSWRDGKARITDVSGITHPHLTEGQWVVIHTQYFGTPGMDILHYARIEKKTDLELQLHIASRHPVPMGLAAYEAVKRWDWENAAPTTALLVLCNRSLDDIEDNEEKAFLLTLLLSSLPSVGEMRSYLMGTRSRQLAAWNRIPPSAIKLLRWIIASNRSFIVQVDSPLSNDANSGVAEDKRPDRSQEKILGVDGWIQFRFAQGSPEKEYIVWPESSLKITQAISLNELVNLPGKFQHSVSCYVVDKLHWIQCRYLFVRPMHPDVGMVQEQKSVRAKAEEFEQDPKYAITGPQNKKLFVPKIAIPSVQQQPHRTLSPPSELINDSNGADANDTDDEDINDINFLTPMNNHQSHQYPQTDFRPGSLDFSQLPQLALPSYATKPAQQTIQRELQKLQKVQSTTPLHELGWYLDFDKIDNMFQWIVELHSFDPGLPLAKDMKAVSITSIVLEIRFLRGYPLTPPFIRVVKPKFLPFASGGGGHVTAGGAMCLELLTNTGWSPVSSMESVLLQVRIAMCNLEPRPARLEMSTSGNTQYSIREAVEAYMRAAAVHGWEVPAELKETTLT